MIRLEQVGANPRRQPGTTLDQPIEHLLACHRRIEERLDIMLRAAEHLGDKRDEAMEAIGNSFYFLDTNGAWHTADEEQSFFPRLLTRITESDKTFLKELEAAHGEIENVYRDVKILYDALAGANPGLIQTTVEEFRKALWRLSGLYRRHIVEEDTRLVSICRESLDSAQLNAVSREMRARRGLAPRNGGVVSSTL